MRTYVKTVLMYFAIGGCCSAAAYLAGHEREAWTASAALYLACDAYVKLLAMEKTG